MNLLQLSILLAFVCGFISLSFAQMDFKTPVRAAFVGIDLLVDESDSLQEESNLDNAVIHAIAQGVNTVYIQAFRDADGLSRVNSMYFPNAALGDYNNSNLFVRLANKFKTAKPGLKIGAWMPVLAWDVITINGSNAEYVLTWDRDTQSVIKEDCADAAFYCNLTPFNQDNYNFVLSIYQDLLVAYPGLDIIHGHDDLALNESQDLSPSALAAYSANGFPGTAQGIIGMDWDSDELLRWSIFKSKTISNFFGNIVGELKKTHPNLVSSRHMYVNAFYRPKDGTNNLSVRWLAQDCESALATADFLVPMIYPYHEKETPKTELAQDQFKWYIEAVVQDLKQCDPTLTRIQLSFQTVNWEITDAEGDFDPVGSNELHSWITTAYEQGGRHVSYYPSNHYALNPDTTGDVLLNLMKTDITSPCYQDIQCDGLNYLCNDSSLCSVPVITIDSPSRQIQTSDPTKPYTLPNIIIPFTTDFATPLEYPVIRLGNANTVKIMLDYMDLAIVDVVVQLIFVQGTKEVILDVFKDANPPTDALTHEFTFSKDLRSSSLYYHISFTHKETSLAINTVPFAVLPDCMSPSTSGLNAPWISLCGDHGKCISTNGGTCECAVGFQNSFCTAAIPDTKTYYCNHCVLDNVDTCTLPLVNNQQGTCVCKPDFTGVLCNQAKACRESSESTCNYPNGQLITQTSGKCEAQCTCNDGWSAKNCHICALQCQNGGLAFKKCDKCGCTGGFSGNNCQCRSSIASLTLFGYNINLNLYQEFLDEYNTDKTPMESHENYGDVMFGRTLVINDLNKYIDDVMGLKNVQFVLTSIDANPPLERKITRFSFSFLYGCSESNENTSFNDISIKFKAFAEGLVGSDAVKNHFILSKNQEDALAVEDLTDTEPTLPSEDDRYVDDENNCYQFGNIFVIVYTAFFAGLFF
jgi:uncharacterized lipoprotein YddW (UPF0748 family)